MKSIILSLLVTVSFSTFASAPKILGSELNGVFQGESVNGPCTVRMQRLGDVLVMNVDQNMTQNKTLPVSVKALISKISGDKCGRVTMNNDCGEYSLKDSVQNGGGYNNEVSIAAESVKGQRCLDISVVNASFGEWIGNNSCKINLNRTGKGCPAL